MRRHGLGPECAALMKDALVDQHESGTGLLHAGDQEAGHESIEVDHESMMASPILGARILRPL